MLVQDKLVSLVPTQEVANLKSNLKWGQTSSFVAVGFSVKASAEQQVQFTDNSRWTLKKIFLFLGGFYTGCCACKRTWKFKKGHGPHQQKLLSPTENSAPQSLVSTLTFNSWLCDITRHTFVPKQSVSDREGGNRAAAQDSIGKTDVFEHLRIKKIF